MKFQTLLLPNGMHGSVWGVSQFYNDMGILNISGLINYAYCILSATPSSHLPCGLGYGILVASAALMLIHMDEYASRDEKRSRNRLASIRQPVEL